MRLAVRGRRAIPPYHSRVESRITLVSRPGTTFRGWVRSSACVDTETKKQLLADLLHIAEETRQFDPPYIPSRYVQDVANSDPAELVYKYVQRLWEEGRLDLAVENVAWRYRQRFPPAVGKAARIRFEASEFDVLKQKMK
jgi:hypothetical protein